MCQIVTLLVHQYPHVRVFHVIAGMTSAPRVARGGVPPSGDVDDRLIAVRARGVTEGGAPMPGA